MDTNKFEIKQGSAEYDIIVSKLRPLLNSLKTEEYNKIINALCSGDYAVIADILVSVYEDKKQERMENIRVQGELKEAGVIKDHEIQELRKRVQEMERQLEELHYQKMGISMKDGMRMKLQYEHGMSLRKLAEIYHCDKSTVKRRLLKMGVAIRE